MSQPKVELPHVVVSGVVGPHGCEDLTDRVEVLLDQSLIDRFPLQRQKADTDALGENLEEGNGVLSVLEVGGNFHPAAEAPLQYTKYPSTDRGSSLAVNDRTLDVRVTSDVPSTP